MQKPDYIQGARNMTAKRYQTTCQTDLQGHFHCTATLWALGIWPNCINLSTLLALAKKIVSTLLHKIHCFFIPFGLAHITLPSLGWTTRCKNSG